MAARVGHSMGASIYGDLERPRRWLEEERRAGRRSGITHWRQTLTVSAANQRARAGDRTAARRLAWRALVLKGRRHAEWLVSRAKAHEAELARLRREPSHPDCAACFLRQERSRGNREEFLAEIAQLPGSVPAYRASRHLDFRAAAEGDYWLLRELEPLLGILEGGGRAVDERRQLRVLDGGRA
jgi:hypothetical protein